MLSYFNSTINVINDNGSHGSNMYNDHVEVLIKIQLVSNVKKIAVIDHA